MTNLPRLRPEPIPAISPLPEYLAEGQRKMWYEEVKQVLQVPWMGVITSDVYEDVKRILNLPFVNTDYAALARWPSYWGMAWSDIREIAGTPAHEALCQAIHDRCVEQAVATLPNPGGLTAGALRAAAAADAPLEEIRDMARLFQWLLPGLIVNIAYFRAQLLPERPRE